MLTKEWTRRQYATIACSLLYSVIFILMLIFRPGSKAFYHAFFNVYQILPPLFAGICGISFARKAKHIAAYRRIGWLLIGLGCLSFALGQTIWTYYESVRGIEVPFPGWADAGYLGTYPFLIAGVILLFGSVPTVGRARLLLDSAIAASSIGVPSWHFLVERLWHKSDVTLLGKFISVAYPLGDVASLFGALVLLNSIMGDKMRRRGVFFLAAGLMLLTFGDSTFTYLSLHDAYQTGSWNDWAWSFGWMLIGYASLMQLWWGAKQKPSEGEQPVAGPVGGWRILARVIGPYLAAFLSFSVVALHDFKDDHRISNSTLIVGVGLISLVILRQIFTMLENQHLTRQLRAFNENLESMVSLRTEQLKSLHELTKAVNNTLQSDQVLEVAARHTRLALKADAVALWLLEQDTLENRPYARLYSHEGLAEQPEKFDFIKQQTMSEQVIMQPLPFDPREETEGGGYFLRVPLRWQQQPMGMIGVIRWKERFGTTEAGLLESIGIEVGTALENARLYGAAVEAADRDPVTGLYNHRAIHQRLEKEIVRASKQDKVLSILMMDMNNFKIFNDTYGHPVGDQVLKLVAQVLGEECDSRDILGRYGGDEFIVVLPETDIQKAMEVAERLRDRLLRAGFRRPGEDRIIPITLSFGVASFPMDGTNRHELLTNADANLYKAKQSEAGIMGTSDMQRANRELRAENSFGVLDAMVTAVDNKDRYTRRHSEDVTEYALWIAEQLGLSEETMRVIRIGGLLHDVGKIAVPDEILRKPGRLTPEEYEILKRHPRMGALMVGAIPGMESILDAVRSHHERWDGSGYPDELTGEEIPLLGRIMAVADAFSAMTTDRPYRKGLDWDVAIEEIRANIGTQFDPAIAKAFLHAAERRQPLRMQHLSIESLPKAA